MSGFMSFMEASPQPSSQASAYSIHPSYVIGGFVVIAAVLYYLYIKYIKNDGKDLLQDITPLNVKKDIATPDIVQSTLLGSGGSTVMAFFNLQAGNRTSTYKNDFVPLMMVDNNWWLEISHKPQGEEDSARLRVQTTQGGTLGIELIDLPPIPKQKWIFIAILREGRRFDIIYNNRIVASDRLENYPAVISSSLSIGHQHLYGKTIHIIINNVRMSPDEVERQRVSYVDTNNDIVEDNYIFPSFPTIKLFTKCPPGLPCDPIRKPPKNNMYEWSTPYA